MRELSSKALNKVISLKMRVFILGNARRPGVTDQATQLLPMFEKHFEVVVSDLEQKQDLSKLKADLTIVLGGDGAILRAARQMGYQQIPVLGINLGRLGFLADLNVAELESCIGEVAKGNFRVTRHLMFECLTSMPEHPGPFLGLNEVSVHAGQPFHMIELDLVVDGETVCKYMADGLIFSTPIGSTAHNLSSGGPILSQEIDAFVISPICPHVLTSRSLVDSSAKAYSIILHKSTEGTTLVIDGQQRIPLLEKTKITLRKAPVHFLQAKVAGKNFYRTLREKLSWGVQPNYRPEGKP
ncbi:MAG: hypothetical protein RL595_990 [Planctomycetota bacterium]